MGAPAQSFLPSSVGLELGPVVHEWTERDVMLYALGIGARLPEDLAYVYERGLVVEPTFALTAVTRMLPPLVQALGIDLRHLLHAGQELEVHRVPAASGRCTVRRRVTSVRDKGAAAIVDCEDLVSDAAGLLATARSSWWVRGAGGFGGDQPAPKPAPRAAERAADWRRTVRTTTEQAALHRLSGDLNPVHIDPSFATAAGQPGAFLHGLCTFGLTAHALERAVAPPRRLAALRARFTRPVVPGQTLDLEAWWTPGCATVRVSSPDGPVLDHAEAAFTATPS